jgi:hypothetical protein
MPRIPSDIVLVVDKEVEFEKVVSVQVTRTGLYLRKKID